MEIIQEHIQWVIGAASLVGILMLLWIFVRLLAYIQKRQSMKRLQGRFPLREIQRRLGFYLEHEFTFSTAPQSPVYPSALKYFRDKVFKKAFYEYKMFMVLAPSGTGKTSFMLNLYHAYRRHWNRDYRIHLFPAYHPRLVALLTQIEKKEHSVLLLDAFDEEGVAAENYRTRMDALMPQLQAFAKVLISCNTDFFPADLERSAESETLRYVGDSAYQLFAKIYLLPFTEKQQKRYVKQHLRNYPAQVWQNAQYHLKASQSVMQYPVNLLQLPRLAHRDTPYHYLYQVWEEVLTQWVGQTAESGSLATEKLREELALQNILEEMALDMLQRLPQRGALFVPQAVFHQLARKYDISPRPLQYDVIDLNPSGQLIFAHPSFAYYLVARRFFNFRDKKTVPLENFPEEVLQYFEEMCWEQYRVSLHEEEGEPGFYLLAGETAQRPLSQINQRDLREVRRLFLERFRHIDLHFLRPMKTLQGLYLMNGKVEDLELAWEKYLPHAQTILYLLPRKHSVQAYERNPDGAEGEKEMWREVAFYRYLNPEAPLEEAAALEASTKILKIFGVDLLSLPNEEAVLLGVGKTPTGENYSIYDLFLGGEWELFDRLTLHKFESGTQHVWLYNTFTPALLHSILEKLLKKLVDLMSQDDEYRSYYAEDDRVQIELGHWMGRRWAWKNADTYAYPVQLFMDKPGQLHLQIFGLPGKG